MIARYIHDKKVHNFDSSIEIVPFLIELFQPESIIDVGCGTGTWLKTFSEKGACNILGVDGNYVKRELLEIDEINFLEHDLENKLNVNGAFDLVLCLEVAEHLSESRAESFIDDLVKLGDIIVFSAAITNQGGQNHLNEQPPTYWINKFKEHNYESIDILRPKFWNNKKVDWWYKQNIMLFSSNRSIIENLKCYDSFCGAHLVHPILFQNFHNIHNNAQLKITGIESGKKEFKYYFNLLLKNLLYKIKR